MKKIVAIATQWGVREWGGKWEKKFHVYTFNVFFPRFSFSYIFNEMREKHKVITIKFILKSFYADNKSWT